jgi:stage II sporulation protein D
VSARPLLAVALAAALPALAACADISGSRERATGPRSAPSIDVELWGGSQSVPPVACDGSWVAVDGAGRQVGQGSVIPPDVLPPEIGAERVLVFAHDLGPPPVVLQPRSRAVFTVAGKPYRGDIVLDVDARRGVARILNRLPLEDYLLGVVPGEMPDRFGLEALKAQAVAARSYALSESEDRGFVFDDTRSQVYGGRSIETVLGTRAVRETAGQVLVSRNRVVKAYYHSTCGGRTATAESVFPDTPYGVMNRPVTCPDCRQSPFYSWRRSFDAASVCAACGLPVGHLDHASIEPAAVPGRPETITISADGHDVTLGMTSFREHLSAGRPFAEQLPSSQLSAAPRIEEGALVLEGRGWGHGVGMCQYGASGFAARGANCEAILSRYYPGAELAPIP